MTSFPEQPVMPRLCRSPWLVGPVRLHVANGPGNHAGNGKWWCSFLYLASVLLAAFPGPAAAASEAEKAAVIGQPASLVVQPETIRLSGPRATQQVLVTGRYRNGTERDLTPFCDFGAEV